MFDIEIYLNSLPEDTEEINVSDKGIKTLDVTRFKNLKILYCSDNQLTSLHLNEELQELFCRNNQLTSLHLNEKLLKLYCTNNQLTSLHLNKNLRELYCPNNRLSSLHLNEKLQRIVHKDNPIYEIIGNKNINQNLKILNQFRYLYYCLKYKKRFRDLLWVKIREPKIREKYSHDYLVKNLHEDTDLDALLNNW
jgi:hypothetical protein